ncbi:hypothetical protein WS7_03285 [Xanthomonas citri pv. malvacearum str. GSPB2388]|nr:hypothetical protein WS7_03285 [Xanthomonas citri pv. malvacearum str. GSPB2388]
MLRYSELYLPLGEVRCTTMVSVGDCFCVVTPWRRTSSGRRACAWLTRFCTCTCLKVTVTTSTPSEPATDFMYIMFSTPLMASSSGVATVSAMTLGLAPGYTARTCTLGGTTSGYSLIGRSGMAIRPAAKMMIDSTAAKIGRSMKKREKSIGMVLKEVAAGWRRGTAGPGRPGDEAGSHGLRCSDTAVQPLQVLRRRQLGATARNTRGDR